jgi:chromosome segregation ATPase
MSRNIKDFKEGDILRFNCAGDGVIELVSRDGETPKDQAADLKAAQDKITALTAENKELRERKEAFLKDRETLFTKKAELEESLKLASTNLGLSEADKVSLQQQLDAATEKIKTLEVENATLKAANDKFLADLKARCEKLSIQVNGQNHKPELFAKEIAALSMDEIRTKIAGLETQLAALFPPGRKSQDNLSVLTGDKQDKTPVNHALYKID